MTELFSIYVKHEYFQWEIDKNMNIQPKEQTLNLIRQYGFLTDISEGTFKLYAGWKEEDTASRMKYLQQLGHLYIELQISTRSEAFYNYTDLPTDFVGRLRYSSSFDQNESKESLVTLKSTEKETGDFPEFAVVRIYFSDILAGKRQYEISLSSRKTRWEYYIINSSKIEFSTPAISEQEEVRFSAGKNVTLENGQKALAFKMQNATLPLTEKVKYQFDLVNGVTTKASLPGRSKDKIIVKGLPNPSPSELKVVHTPKGTDVSSPMYVYV